MFALLLVSLLTIPVVASAERSVGTPFANEGGANPLRLSGGACTVWPYKTVTCTRRCPISVFNPDGSMLAGSGSAKLDPLYAAKVATMLGQGATADGRGYWATARAGKYAVNIVLAFQCQ